MFQDMYFSNDNDLNNPLNNAAHNTGLIQSGTCFTVLGSQGRDEDSRFLHGVCVSVERLGKLEGPERT